MPQDEPMWREMVQKNTYFHFFTLVSRYKILERPQPSKFQKINVTGLRILARYEAKSVKVMWDAWTLIQGHFVM